MVTGLYHHERFPITNGSGVPKLHHQERFAISPRNIISLRTKIIFCNITTEVVYHAEDTRRTTGVTVTVFPAMSGTDDPVVTLPCNVFVMNITVETTILLMVFRRQFLLQFGLFSTASSSLLSRSWAFRQLNWPFLRPPYVLEIMQLR